LPPNLARDRRERLPISKPKDHLRPHNLSMRNNQPSCKAQKLPSFLVAQNNPDRRLVLHAANQTRSERAGPNFWAPFSGNVY
jgi:hypothetical protein